MPRSVLFRIKPFKSPLRAIAAAALAAGAVGCVNAGDKSLTLESRPAMLAQAGNVHTSSPFKGIKANTGTATHRTLPDGKQVLSVSDDFVIPNTPAPHWQVVDSEGNVYLLQQLRIKDNTTNRTITLPAYIKDVAKVRIWCSYAEALLGEASFAMPVR